VLDQRLTSREDPSVHDVLRLLRRRVIHKVLVVRPLVQFSLSQEESERVDPFADDGVSDLSDTFILEDQVVTPDDGRVDKV
jgi:hypothetical protein